MQHAQVAVQGFRHVEDVRARAGRVEGAGELEADVGALAGAADGQAAAAGAGERGEQLDGAQERRVEASGDLDEGGGLGADDLAGVVEPVVGRVEEPRHGGWASVRERTTDVEGRGPASDYTGGRWKCNTRWARRR